MKASEEKWELFKPDHIGCQNIRIGKDIGFGAFIEVWYHQFNNIEEAKKIALLISKAPEMLEMLNNVKDYLGSDVRENVEQLIKEATEL